MLAEIRRGRSFVGLFRVMLVDHRDFMHSTDNGALPPASENALIYLHNYLKLLA
jgi:hypothetical protein